MDSDNISPSYQKKAFDPLDGNQAPGMHQDFTTRKMLKKAERNINSNNKWTYLSFFLEFVVFIVLIAAWGSLSKINPPSDEEVLKNLKIRVQKGIDDLGQKTKRVKELENKLVGLKQTADGSYGQFQTKMDTITSDQGQTTQNINDLHTKIERYNQTMSTIAKCGKTKKMTKKFTISKDTEAGQMKCSGSKPCYCYGKICLVPKNKDACNQGNVFIKATPLCGIPSGWDDNLGKVICQELGFRDVEKTTSNEEFGEASSLHGWFYLSKTFNKNECNYKDTGLGDIPSIADCVGHGKFFSGPITTNNYCEWKNSGNTVEKTKGIVCTI